MSNLTFYDYLNALEQPVLIPCLKLEWLNPDDTVSHDITTSLYNTNGTLNIEDEDKLRDMLNKDELTLEEILHLNMSYELAIGNLKSSLKLLKQIFIEASFLIYQLGSIAQTFSLMKIDFKTKLTKDDLSLLNRILSCAACLSITQRVPLSSIKIYVLYASPIRRMLFSCFSSSFFSEEMIIFRVSLTMVDA